jgi:2-deoxy-D-gluconate 3-dehydrogenase
MDLRLDGKVALVTGAFGGLGRDFARILAEAGAAVALARRRIEEGRALAPDMAKAGHRVCAVPIDVAARESVDAAKEASRGGRPRSTATSSRPTPAPRG